MLNYIKKKSKERGLSVLRYTGAFADGMRDRGGYYHKCCPKLLKAYRDGKRYKKEFDSKTSSW